MTIFSPNDPRQFTEPLRHAYRAPPATGGHTNIGPAPTRTGGGRNPNQRASASVKPPSSRQTAARRRNRVGAQRTTSTAPPRPPRRPTSSRVPAAAVRQAQARTQPTSPPRTRSRPPTSPPRRRATRSSAQRTTSTAPRRAQNPATRFNHRGSVPTPARQTLGRLRPFGFNAQERTRRETAVPVSSAAYQQRRQRGGVDRPWGATAFNRELRERAIPITDPAYRRVARASSGERPWGFTARDRTLREAIEQTPIGVGHPLSRDIASLGPTVLDVLYPPGTVTDETGTGGLTGNAEDAVGGVDPLGPFVPGAAGGVGAGIGGGELLGAFGGGAAAGPAPFRAQPSAAGINQSQRARRSLTPWSITDQRIRHSQSSLPQGF